MNHKIRYAILAVCISGILLALILVISSPELYSQQMETFPSNFHKNTDELTLSSVNSTTDIFPVVQDVLDSAGSVSLNLHINNIEQAQYDLQKLGASQQLLNKIVVKLDMRESEIQELQNNVAAQKELLASLINTSVSLDSLQSLEIQYQSEDNQDMLSTVRLQGNDLRKKVQDLDTRYQKATEHVTLIGKKVGLNVTKNQESQTQVEALVKEIESPIATSGDTVLIPGEDRVSLFLRPDSGKYRDIIEYMGISLTLNGNTTLRSEGTQIRLYLDDQLLSNTTADKFGYYNVKLPIDRIPAGSHTIYARSPTSRSANQTLTVIPADSVTNLTISSPDQNGNVNCTGYVSATYPVAFGSVQITWDETHIIITKTDANGFFSKEVQLPPGAHTIIADFPAIGYPINPSASEPQVVNISILPAGNQLLLTLGVIGIFLLFLGAAVFYIWRMTRKRLPLPEGTFWNKPDPTPSPTGNALPEPAVVITSTDQTSAVDAFRKLDTETVITYYVRILQEQGLSAASWCAYQQMAARIARDLHIKRYKSLTAREMSRICKGKPYCGTFVRMTSAYERIRYGNDASGADRALFENAMQLTDEQTGGEHH
jgi:hypothetical protein